MEDDGKKLPLTPHPTLLTCPKNNSKYILLTAYFLKKQALGKEAMTLIWKKNLSNIYIKRLFVDRLECFPWCYLFSCLSWIPTMVIIRQKHSGQS